MPYGFKVELDSKDISDKVSRFEIVARLDAYVRELSLELADPDVYDTLDFGQLPESTRLEVFTRIATEWISQGTYFLEKPTYTVGLHSTTTGLWGRSATALLGPPFAPKVRKLWDEDTTFFAICEEMCDLAGLTWSDTYSETDDFIIYAYTYQADGLYPCEVISELLTLARGPDAFLTTDRSDHVCIKLLDRAPTVADHTITDTVTVRISEEPEWPDFGNRIKISAAGAIGGFGVNVTTPTQCLLADGTARAKLFARVTGPDGAAINDLPVTWTAPSSLVTLDRTTTNTQTVRIDRELQRAKNFHQVDLAHPPETIVGIWAYRDTARATNLAESGYTVSGNTVTLATTLAYCDQLLVITYTAKGVAVNWVTTGTTVGTETVSADIGGNTGSIELYIGDPCQCPPSITLRVNPSSIEVGESARLLVYCEIAGAAVTDNRKVYLTIDSTPSHGRISWTEHVLEVVAVTNERSSAINEISGVTQCELAMFADSVVGVWRAIENSDGDLVKTGADLYSSHDQKLVTLNTSLTTGTELIVDYAAIGAAVAGYQGYNAGTDRVRAIMITTREARTEAEVTITVSANAGDDPGPDDCCNDGLCQADEVDCNAPTGGVSGTQMGRGVQNGRTGCFPVAQCDRCNVGTTGYVIGYKDGQMGCYASSELDACTDGEAGGMVYGQSAGKDGCYGVNSLDQCTEAGKKRCYSGGVLGCYLPEECDTKYGGSGTGVECGDGTTCCKHKVTGLMGCWPSDQCVSTPPGGGDDDDPEDWDDDPNPDCQPATGAMIKCKAGEACCSKGGVRGCWPWQECDQGKDYCYSTDCTANPTPECLGARFGPGLQDGGDGCSCLEMCDKEFDKLNTTQGYSEAGIKTAYDAGNAAGATGSPAFWEAYEAFKASALEACRQACGDCEAMSDVVLEGSETATSPGGYQYLASGGEGPYTWSVAGSGASIDQTGYVTLQSGACGSFTVSVSDKCGRSATVDTRITNNGRWVVISNVSTGCEQVVGGACNCIVGKYWYTDVRRSMLYQCSNPLSAKCPECGGFEIAAQATREWQC